MFEQGRRHAHFLPYACNDVGVRHSTSKTVIHISLRSNLHFGLKADIELRPHCTFLGQDSMIPMQCQTVYVYGG